MSIDIRPAIESDTALIVQLIRELAEYEHLASEMVATEQLIRTHLFGPAPAAHALIASLDNQPVGFALCFQNFSTFLGRPGIYLEDLFVRPAARGKGVGNALLLEVARVAKKIDAGRLEWSVLDWNEPAIGFYKKLGAVPMDQWTIFRVTGKALDDLAAQ
jgi:GNAT superfamily N-acetyltransferase